MSSLVAHVAVGTALYFRNGVHSRVRSPGQAYLALAILVLLAIAPDFDYLPIWLCRFRFEQRITHSILFCCCMSALAWFIAVKRCRLQATLLTPLTVVLASCSHLALDLLAGRSLPLFWPLTNAEFSWQFDILPGVAHTGLISYYFWRNLLVECGILWPPLCALTVSYNKLLTRKNLPEIILVLIMWAGLIYFSQAARQPIS